MGGVSDAYGEGASCLDVFYGLMGFGKVKGHIAPFLHGAPGGVHDVYASVLIVGGHH